MKKIWDYYIPSANHEGWGKFIIDSTGYFSCVSDYGNWAFQWTAHGDEDFREFLADIGTDYLMGKLSLGQSEINSERTRERLRQEIINSRRRAQRHGELNGETKDEARDVWDELEHAQGEYELTKIIDEHWKLFPDPCKLISYGHPRDLQFFCERLWPRFVEVLKAELLVTEKVYKEAKV